MAGSIAPLPDENSEQKIRLLLVDDIPETRENLRKLLFFESDIEVVGAAMNGEEGMQMAVELQPEHHKATRNLARLEALVPVVPEAEGAIAQGGAGVQAEGDEIQ